MLELLRTNDPTVIPFATAMLAGEGIECFELDANISMVEGSIGIFPRRLVVHRRDFYRARAILIDLGIEGVKDKA